ncbi:MAG: hypothetical protein JWP12_709 [Bacteroidetes bacterium]|nr:hypothetical protein [Bacteroidota bacterium]
MTEQKQPSPAVGYFLIVIGILGIAARLFISSGSLWSTVAIVKLVFSIAVLAFGLFTVFKKRQS